jgi:hypothetical protein
MKLINKFRKSLFIAGLMVSMFALNVVSAFAQEADPLTHAEVLTSVTSWAEGSQFFIVAVAAAMIGLGLVVLRRLLRGTA